MAEKSTADGVVGSALPGDLERPYALFNLFFDAFSAVYELIWTYIYVHAYTMLTSRII